MPTITTETIRKSMVDMREGRITPDQFRAIQRQSREQNGEAKHTHMKACAIAAFNG